MLNSAFGGRMILVEMAMHGVVRVTVKRTAGIQTYDVTLLPNCMECARQNADEYYRRIGMTRYKARKARKLKNAGQPEPTWQQLVDKSINELYIVDIETFSWRKITMRSLVHFEFLGFGGEHA